MAEADKRGPIIGQNKVKLTHDVLSVEATHSRPP
jgi:hypothetical protein